MLSSLRPLAVSLCVCSFACALTQDLPRRGTLGVAFGPLTAEIRKQDRLPPNQGFVANMVVPGSTGDTAGVKQGDILVAFNGHPVIVGGLLDQVRSAPAGSIVKLTVLRDGKQMILSAPLQAKPADPGNENYSVQYSFVLSNGKRMRTLISHPKASGRHPGLMFIQGFGPTSYDYNLAGYGPDAPILFSFANTGFVTMRVEKPGVGDSEGGPLRDLDYYQEMDIYRQALKQLLSQTDVDPNQIYIFGHSMGGAFGPMLACETPIKGIICYGIEARTWEEYFNDINRYQNLLGGMSYADIDNQVRINARAMNAVFQEGKSPAQVEKEHPEWKAIVESTFPDGTFSQRATKFWTQLEDINFESFWAKCNSHVLACWGESDFVSYKIDHQLVADIVNKQHPGWARFLTIPNSDHVLANWKSQEESFQHFPNGQFNPAFIDVIKTWLDDVKNGKA